VASLALQPWPGGRRLLLMTLSDRRIFSLVLEACAPQGPVASPPATPPRARPHHASPSRMLVSPAREVERVPASPYRAYAPSTPQRGPLQRRRSQAEAEEAAAEREADSLWERCVGRNEPNAGPLASPRPVRPTEWLGATCGLGKVRRYRLTARSPRRPPLTAILHRRPPPHNTVCSLHQLAGRRGGPRGRRRHAAGPAWGAPGGAARP
jgi:hypothetical protein